MRAFLLILIGTFLAGEAAHALRGVLPGAACSRIPEIEASLGSKVRGTPPADPEADATLLFEGRSRGRAASISYHCKSGKVASQLITIEVATERDGQSLFSDWRRELVSRFGPPWKDLDEKAIAEVEEAVEHPTRRFATWVVGERVVSVTLWAGSKGTWEVVAAGP